MTESLFKELKKCLLKNFYLIKEGVDLEVEINNYLIALTNTFNQKYNLNKTKSIIDLLECEQKLKNFYNISNNSYLYILKIDFKEEGMKIPKIEYEIFFPLIENELKKLNLTICKNLKIDILNPIKINENIDKYNISSNYYRDVCSRTTSETGTDICLNDRKKIFLEKNLTLCEEDCDLIGYDKIIEKARCSCITKINLPLINDIKFNKDKLSKSFKDINNVANIKFLKCYKNVFNFDILKKNYGLFIFIFIFIIYFLCLFIFCFQDYNKLESQIKSIFEAKNKIFNLICETKNESEEKIKNRSNKKIINKKEKKYINKRTKNYCKNNKLKRKIKNKRPLKKNKNKINCAKIENLEYDSKNILVNEFLEISNNNIMYNEYQNILEYNDNELNSLIYDEAVKYDKRSYIQYYFSLLKANHLLIFSFYSNNKDYNSQIIKIFLFFFFFSLNLTINALFFNDNTMHKIYIDEGNFDFIYHIPQILYSAIISTIISTIIKYLSLSEKNVIEIKQIEKKEQFETKSNTLLRNLKIKFTLFFSISFIFLLMFMYYIICFCGIYINTQIILIKDTSISFSLSLIYPLGINIVPGIFRISALKAQMKDKNCLYKFSQLIENL